MAGCVGSINCDWCAVLRPLVLYFSMYINKPSPDTEALVGRVKKGELVSKFPNGVEGYAELK